MFSTGGFMLTGTTLEQNEREPGGAERIWSTAQELAPGAVRLKRCCSRLSNIVGEACNINGSI